ncbi:Sugar or nucleoside kinase, ribokinase family [Quadrisphaera granulorum]|uniref:Sugar/nucleoside kinase (Ribokinase family) n=1 Tax=Quadrisphaera granulorum TaxID=317664 RepID=A0A316AUT0_9ACTN|nr:PfkB family carbohydrate kinase [Quadrisphaera granulorum]PWJ53857.1 sugar/nucleoside kinase (ribokinase family) [Quadrisphaera granulorum]SZE96614.1 Sugar or nucleoside kinase, ribokinase family [Quadrisphaera granulorum]
MAPTHPQVVTLGAHVLDTVVLPVDEIPPGQGFALVDEIHVCAAGPAGGTAVVLAKLGARVHTVGAIGDDAAGRLLSDLLARAGVDTTHLRTCELPTSASVLPIRTDGSRPALHVVGATPFSADEVPWDLIATSDHLHVGAPELLGPENVVELLRFARAHGTTTSVDFLIGGDPGFFGLIRPLLPEVDQVLPNAEQVLGWTGAATLHEAATALADLGARCAAITNGGEATLVLDDGRVSEVPIAPAEVVDTSGGGDAFSAGFLMASLAGHSAEEAARFGSATASHVVAGIGTDHGDYDYARVEAVALALGSRV